MNLLEFEGGENPISLPPPPVSPAPSQAPHNNGVHHNSTPGAAVKAEQEQQKLGGEVDESINSSQGGAVPGYLGGAAQRDVVRVAGVLGRGSSKPAGGAVKTEVKFIVVPQRQINFGCDIKFEEDPMVVKLGGLMKGDEYAQSICPINDALKECRSTNLDHALLAMGPAMLPLIPWAIRSKQHKQMRRKIIQRCIASFNKTNTLGLTMRWQTRPVKELTIWRREEAEAEANA